MISKIVTVTCKQDLTSMIRLAESIQKFVKPCEHLVIIQDTNFNERFWVEHLSKYYTNHNLVIKCYNSYLNFKHKGKHILNHNGWHVQQAFKLLACLDCEGKYLIVDSKDFFIRPTQLSDWEGYTGSNILQDLGYGDKREDNWYLTLSLLYANYFETDLIEKGFNPITPFIIDTKFIDKNKIQDLVKDLLTLYHTCSEFIFYNYMALDLIEHFKPHRFKSLKLWGVYYKDDATFNSDVQKALSEATNDKDVMVFGIHRKAIARFTPEQKQTVNDWIKSIGLMTEI